MDWIELIIHTTTQGADFVSGLLMDMMTNGLGSVMTVVYEQVPSFAAMLSSNTAAAQ